MLETMRILRRPWAAVLALATAGCVTAPPPPAEPAPPPVVAAPPVSLPAPAPGPDPAARMEEARAHVAQAETDIQRARAKRALWQKAWEDLVAARQAIAAQQPERAIDLARRASELAQLGLEQLAYPAVR